MLCKDYRNVLVKMMDELIESEIEKIKFASETITEKIINGGVIFAFGTGHSHCVAEEICGRAGGLGTIDVILEASLIGATGFTKSQYLERLEGFAEPIINHRGITDKDVLLIISNSGRNTVPVEMAIKAKERKIFTVAITSFKYSKHTGPRNKYGKCLYEVVDVAIDNQGIVGDACIKLAGLEQPICSTSNIMSSFAAQLICGEICKIMVEKGIEPPIFMSGNLDGADEKNDKMTNSYKHRIKAW